MGINRDIFLAHFNEIELGLEQESLRVDSHGKLSKTPHPFVGESHIDRDFCENQVEMITDVYYSVDELINGLTRLKSKVASRLLHLESGEEYLWQFSSPPAVDSEGEIPIAHFVGELAEKEKYRNYLAQKYGKWQMLFSGIHFNFSFPDSLVRELYKAEGEGDYRAFKDSLYLKLGKKFAEYSWLIVYLTAASPVLDDSFGGCPFDKLKKYASPRCGEIGYWNDFLPEIDFSSVDNYVSSIENYINSGELYAPSELYYPVRLKPQGGNSLGALKESGINHIELRVLDLNPLVPCGIDGRDLYFIYLLAVYLVLEELDGDADLECAVENIKSAALYDESSIKIRTADGQAERLCQPAVRLFDKMEALLGGLGDKVRSCIDFQRNKVQNPSERYAVRLRQEYESDYIGKGLSLAVKNTNALLNNQK